MKTLLAAALLMLTPDFDPVGSCRDKAVGAPCHVTLTDGDHDGVCLAGPPDEPFSCMPTPPPGPTTSVPVATAP